MRILAVGVAFLVSQVLLLAQQPALKLHALFGDHMVLPQKATVPLRGRCKPLASVSITVPWVDATIDGKADADGRFAVAIATPAASGPFELVVTAGSESRTLHDVLIGDVWLGSGQSNMEWKCGWLAGSEKDIASASHPTMRLFTVRQRTAPMPVEDVVGEWQVCTPATVKEFSATAYFFGRAIQAARKEPLGLVVSAWGGTICEAWTSDVGLKDFPEFTGAIQDIQRTVADTRSFAERAAPWWQALAEKDPVSAGHRPEANEFDDATWAEVDMPHNWSQGKLAKFDGVGWYRTKVAVPDAWAGKDLTLSLGAIDDLDTVWFGGERIGGTEEPGHWNEARHYVIPGRLVRGGEVVLAVRVVDTAGGGGFISDAETLRLAPVQGEGGGIGLAKKWRFLAGAAMGSLPAMPREQSNDPNQPTVLWNGMIAPLLQYPFKGALWYQGESNRERAEQYGRLFPAMIRDWRRAFASDLPFYFVQIAPYGYGGDKGELFDLRIAQTRALGPNTGMAVTTDIGDPRDIHPRDKQSVGQRLALQALKHTYGQTSIDADPPQPMQVKREGKTVRITFANAANGMRAGKDGPHHFDLKKQY